MKDPVIVKVGIADLNVTKNGGLLRTVGLGSCVGVALWDPVSKAAGMAHVMLPDSSIARGRTLNQAKYADTAIPELLKRMEQIGGVAGRLTAKLAGGAQMFTLSSSDSDAMRIGQRNVEACKASLNRYNIPILAEDTGGNYGRTIELDSETGVLLVRSIQHGTKEI
jgi:chemotaxis protein CheD